MAVLSGGLRKCHLNNQKSLRFAFCFDEVARENGADYRSRTGDLLITSQLLYQLS